MSRVSLGGAVRDLFERRDDFGNRRGRNDLVIRTRAQQRLEPHQVAGDLHPVFGRGSEWIRPVWETVTQDGIEMQTRPAHWGQAQVELERDGTFLHLMADTLTRDQVLRIAAGLRPVPSTSSI